MKLDRKSKDKTKTSDKIMHSNISYMYQIQIEWTKAMLRISNNLFNHMLYKA